VIARVDQIVRLENGRVIAKLFSSSAPNGNDYPSARFVLTVRLSLAAPGKPVTF